MAVTNVMFVITSPAAGLVRSTTGGVVSAGSKTRKVRVAVPTLPAASVAVAVKEWAPPVRMAVVNDQAPELLAVAVPSRVAPS